MALIGTLRNKLGKVVVVFIFLALAAFVLSDLLTGGGSIFFSEDTDVGEIDGTDITQRDYSAALEQAESIFKQNNPGASGNTVAVQNHVWQMLITEYAVNPQIEKLGIVVSDDELEDMVWGNNIADMFKQNQYFLNEAGEVDRNKIQNYAKGLNPKYEPAEGTQQWLSWQQERMRWISALENIRSSRKRLKYENLLIKSTYVTKAEAERDYHFQNDVAEIQYLNIPYHTISDSTVTLTDADYEAYYQENKKEFKTDHVVDFSFVSFPILPSAEDSAAVYAQMNQVAENFRKATNDSLFAVSQNQNPNAYKRYSPKTLPSFIEEDSIVAGKVIGPFQDGNTLKVVKFSKVIPQDSVAVSRASHILIQFQDTTEVGKLTARIKAEAVLDELREGANFATKAQTASDDPGSARQGGDLGWQETRMYVKPFREALENAKSTGLIDHLVESQFGFHIISVTNMPNYTGYYMGVVEEPIEPSDVTEFETEKKARMFVSSFNDVEQLKIQAKKENLFVREAPNLSADPNTGIPGVGQARQIIVWLFREAEVGEVTEKPFNINKKQIIVGIKTAEVEAGYQPLSRVKDQITSAVRNVAKSKVIEEKLKSTKGSLEEMKAAFPESTLSVVNNFKLTNRDIGADKESDPEIIGSVFALEEGKRSEPLAGESGVGVIELQSKTIAPEIADYSFYKQQQEQSLSRSASGAISQAIEDHAEIKDWRYRFH